MAGQRIKVVITIPAYNEDRTIGKTIAGIRLVMDNTKYSSNYKILVYDDGSTDGTVREARKNGAIVYSNKRNLGLAETFKNEVKACIKENADIIVHTDADGQYEESAIPRMIGKIQEGYDLVLGSRFRGKIKGMPLSKRLGNILFSRTISWLTGVKITDSTTGFRAFTRVVAADINIINTFTYTQEQIIKASQQKFRISEVPVNTRKTRESRLFRSPVEYAVKAWVNIFRIYRDYAPIKFFGLFGGMFFGAGLILGILILYSFLTSGFVGAMPRVMLTVLLISIGFQILLFGFLADMLRK